VIVRALSMSEAGHLRTAERTLERTAAVRGPSGVRS
jgi:hypothetical protein